MEAATVQDEATNQGNGNEVPQQSETRLRTSTTLALIMAILGSAVLPVSYAFATTGIAVGLIISVVVALANAYTCYLLLQAANATGTSTFEELCGAIAGKPFMRFAQFSNVVLLVGNLTGDMCLLADLGSKSLISSFGDDAPDVLVSNNGRGIMLLLVLTVIFPLSLFKGMRALEHVASAGNVIVVILCGVLTYDAFSNNFYGVTSGEVPLWRVSAKSENIAEAFALIGFSFYLHPLMMPMLQELPPGKRGAQIMTDSLNFVIMVVALFTFSYIGVMGASSFGAATKGDIMMNHLIPAHIPALMFSLAMLVYLSSCIPPIVLSLRCYLDYMLVGPRAPFQRTRFMLLTVGIIAVPLALAAKNPSLSAQAYALTGATGVCIVCYIIPIVAHFKLLHSAGRAQSQDEADSQIMLLETGEANRDQSVTRTFKDLYAERPCTPLAWLSAVALPVLVLLIGCSLSALALYVNLS